MKTKFLYYLKVFKGSINVSWKLRLDWAEILGSQFISRFLEGKRKVQKSYSFVRMWICEALQTLNWKHWLYSVNQVMGWRFCGFGRALGWSENKHCCPELMQISPNLNSLAFKRDLENLWKPHGWNEGWFICWANEIQECLIKEVQEDARKSRYDKSKTKCSSQYILLPVTYDCLTAQVHKLSEELLSSLFRWWPMRERGKDTRSQEESELIT